MHNEEEVIECMCTFLEEHGFTNIVKRGVFQKKYDIEGIAPNQTQRFAIEAKGATRTKPPVNKDKPFSRSTVYSGVATAYFCASTYGPKGILAGVAFPKNNDYKNQIEEILLSLRQLKIEVFWVLPDGKVEVEKHWDIWNELFSSH